MRDDMYNERNDMRMICTVRLCTVKDEDDIYKNDD